MTDKVDSSLVNIFIGGGSEVGLDDRLDQIEDSIPTDVVGEAPTDGQQYARENGAWSVVTGGGGSGTPTVPDDGNAYGFTRSGSATSPREVLPTTLQVTQDSSLVAATPPLPAGDPNAMYSKFSVSMLEIENDPMVAQTNYAIPENRYFELKTSAAGLIPADYYLHNGDPSGTVVCISVVGTGPSSSAYAVDVYVTDGYFSSGGGQPVNSYTFPSLTTNPTVGVELVEDNLVIHSDQDSYVVQGASGNLPGLYPYVVFTQFRDPSYGGFTESSISLTNSLNATYVNSGVSLLADEDIGSSEVSIFKDTDSVTVSRTVDGQYEFTAEGSGGGIPEAPEDGKVYGRKDAAWEEVATGGGEPALAPGFVFRPFATEIGTPTAAQSYDGLSFTSTGIQAGVLNSRLPDSKYFEIELTPASSNSFAFIQLSEDETLSQYGSQLVGPVIQVVDSGAFSGTPSGTFSAFVDAPGLLNQETVSLGSTAVIGIEVSGTSAWVHGESSKVQITSSQAVAFMGAIAADITGAGSPTTLTLNPTGTAKQQTLETGVTSLQVSDLIPLEQSQLVETEDFSISRVGSSGLFTPEISLPRSSRTYHIADGTSQSAGPLNVSVGFASGEYTVEFDGEERSSALYSVQPASSGNSPVRYCIPIITQDVQRASSRRLQFKFTLERPNETLPGSADGSISVQEAFVLQLWNVR